MATSAQQSLYESDIIAEDVVDPYHLFLRADGIVYVQISADKEETVDLVEKMVEKLGEMVDYKKVPLLIKHKNNALPGKANRDYWATKDACAYSLAEAFLINSVSLRLIANFYLEINKPKRPTKLFSDEQEALKWLKTFM